MPIIKTTLAPNGATVSFHKVQNVSYNPSTAMVALDVASWTDEDSYLAGHNLVWMWPVDATPAILSDLDGGLATIAPFDGASIVGDELGGLDAVKARAWAKLKSARDVALGAGFAWNSMNFQSDEVSQQRIQGGVQLAMLAQAAGQTVTIPWTLTDNTVTDLSGADMINVGLTLGTFVQSVYAKGVTYRDQVNAATTAAEVEAVVWASE